MSDASRPHGSDGRHGRPVLRGDAELEQGEAAVTVSRSSDGRPRGRKLPGSFLVVRPRRTAWPHPCAIMPVARPRCSGRRRERVMQQETYLRTEAATLLEKCTACGKCVDVCPNLPHLPEAAADSRATAAGILMLLRDVAGSNAAKSFVEACCGSARCR